MLLCIQDAEHIAVVPKDEFDLWSLFLNIDQKKITVVEIPEGAEYFTYLKPQGDDIGIVRFNRGDDVEDYYGYAEVAQNEHVGNQHIISMAMLEECAARVSKNG